MWCEYLYYLFCIKINQFTNKGTTYTRQLLSHVTLFLTVTSFIVAHHRRFTKYRWHTLIMYKRGEAFFKWCPKHDVLSHVTGVVLGIVESVNLSTSTAIWRIVMKVSTDIHSSKMMSHEHFCDPQTYSPAPPWGWHLRFLLKIVC